MCRTKQYHKKNKQHSVVTNNSVQSGATTCCALFVFFFIPKTALGRCRRKNKEERRTPAPHARFFIVFFTTPLRGHKQTTQPRKPQPHTMHSAIGPILLFCLLLVCTHAAPDCQTNGCGTGLQLMCCLCCHLLTSLIRYQAHVVDQMTSVTHNTLARHGSAVTKGMFDCLTSQTPQKHLTRLLTPNTAAFTFCYSAFLIVFQRLQRGLRICSLQLPLQQRSWWSYV